MLPKVVNTIYWVLHQISIANLQPNIRCAADSTCALQNTQFNKFPPCMIFLLYRLSFVGILPNTIFQTKALTFEGTGAFLRVLKFFASCTSPQECNLSQTFFYHTIVVGLSHQIHSSLASFFGLFSPI